MSGPGGPQRGQVEAAARSLGAQAPSTIGRPGLASGERVWVWQGSSVVEQRTHKPLVVGSNPTPVTNEISVKGGPSGPPFRQLAAQGR